LQADARLQLLLRDTPQLQLQHLLLLVLVLGHAVLSA
jgi:hypothetical protein